MSIVAQQVFILKHFVRIDGCAKNNNIQRRVLVERGLVSKEGTNLQDRQRLGACSSSHSEEKVISAAVPLEGPWLLFRQEGLQG